MPLPDSLAKAKLTKIGGGKFRLDDRVEIDLQDYIPNAVAGLVSIRRPVEPGGYMRLVINHGFVFDGASGPTLDSDSIRRAALTHDAIYHLLREGALDQTWRKRADSVFRFLMWQGGVNRFRRAYYYLAVRMFGGKAARCR